MCILLSNAWPERGASSIKNIKSRLRSRLTNEMLEGMLQALINGPDVNKSGEIIQESVRQWLSQKKRRKLPYSKQIKERNQIDTFIGEETTEPENTDLVEHDIQQVLSDEESVETNYATVSKSLGLQESDDGDSDYNTESEN